jgi:hypothetical protein
MYSQEELDRLKKTIKYLEEYRNGLVSLLLCTNPKEPLLTHSQYEQIQDELFRVNNFCRSLRKSLEDQNHKKFIGTAWIRIIE